jgi:hypothetical protein
MPVLGTLGAATAKGVGFTAVPAELPDIPTIGTATVVSGVAVSVSYTAPTFDGNTSILSYTAVAFNHPSGTATGITGTAFGPNSGSVTVLGLTSGASYRFRVFATNGIGASGLSGLSNNVTTWVVPTTPTIGTVTYTAGNSFASIAYTQSSSNGGTAITSYTAVAFVSGVASGQTGTLSQATSGSIQVNGLIGGQSYTFRVFATNLVGNSPNSNASSPATAVLTKPDAPTIGTATYTGGVSATVGFTAPANNGGATISSYAVRAYVSGVITAISGSGSSSPLSITGLTKGTTYTFRITATNIYGTGDSSADSNSITPLTVPSAPTIGIPAATSGTAVDVNFTAPTDTGGNSTYITSYTATSTPGNISVTKTTGLPTPGLASVINIPGLTKGQPYTFTVFATNPLGNSATSAASVSITPADIPNAPTINLVTTSTANTGSTGTVIVNYSAPSDNGGAVITSYTATSSPGGITGSVSQAGSGTISVTGLTKGTAYTFTVFATNRVGNSANSNTSSSITPLTVPGAPTIGTATAIGTTSATISYAAPTDTGGSTITNFIATSSPSVALSQSVTGSGVITASGLTKGQTYTFTVAAVNAQGTGANSSSSNSIITWTEPAAPTIGVATEVNATTATIAFTAGSTGGTPIFDFTATAFVGGSATAITATGISSPITVTGLTQGTTYTFRVTARNSVGTSPSSGASNTVQPADRPSKPATPTVSTSSTYTTDGRVTVTFTAPFDGGTTILDYSFISNPATTTRTVTQAGGGTYVFTGLTKGTAYTFSYAARNRIGISAYSDASSSITPLTVPNVPIIGTAARLDATSVTVGYTASTDNGGTTITSYTATSTPGGITGSSLGNPITVTGLTKGTSYTFTVKANNSRGSSGESTSSNSAIPATIPNAPTIGTATVLTKNSISVAFTAPADNGGNTIFSYTAVSNPGNISNTINQSGSGSITVTGLSPATSYTFIVYATNTYGNSANSGSSNSATTLNSYAVSASPTTINETSNRTVTFTIATIGVANGSTLYWTNTGTTTAADFDDGVNSGSFTISASGSPPVGSGSVSRTTVTDIFTEGTETIVFNLQSTPGVTEATASVNVSDTSVTPTPTYSIVADQTSINETTNRTVNFSISTTYVPNGTPLYWQLYTAGGVNGADFTVGTSTGSVSISGATGTPQTGGTASFSLTTTTDQLTEGGEAFFIYLGTNSPASSFNVTTSQVISIADTSFTPGVVTISPSTATRNIVKTGLALTVTGSYVTTMSSGTPGTITNQHVQSLGVFSSFSVSPTSRTFTALGQTQTANWSVTTNAIDYSNTSYNITFASVLDTADPNIPNNYPTHAITLNRIAYTQNITVSPTSGRTNTTFTYTVTGAPGTTFEYWNNGGGYAGRITGTLSGSVGDANPGTFVTSAVFWVDPGTYTIYVKWNATGHGDPNGGFSAGYATNTQVAVVVTYPPLNITPGFFIGTFWQVTQSGVWGGNQPTFTASGGSGSGYSFSTPGLPSGITQNPSTGTLSGTPNVAGDVGVTTTVTDSAGNTASYSHTLYVYGLPAITSASLAGGKTTYTVGENLTVSWSSSNTIGVFIVPSSTFTTYSVDTTGSLTIPAASYASTFTVFVYPRFFNGSNYPSGSVALNYTVYAAATITFGSTAIAPPYNSSTSTSTTVKGGETAYFNWTSTNATAVTYFISTNGSGFTGPNAVGLQGPSGPLVLGDVTITSTTYFTLYLQAVNGAGSVVNSQQASIFWTPYNEVLSISPSTTFSGASGCLLTVTGCYPNESIGFSINNTSYADGTVTADSSGVFTNPSAFAGSAPGTYTLYIRMATTTHTRQVTITAT